MEVGHHSSMRSIDAAAWNRLADHSPTPLLSWEWLHHLEESGSIVAEYGWQPAHMTFHEGPEMVGAVPLYLRDHSWGEFVFDFAFAEVAEKLGKRYYPKLVGMSPVSPVPAFSFLIAQGREDELSPAMLGTIREYCTGRNIPVLQFNFVLPQWVQKLGSRGLGLQEWSHHGFEWTNEGFSSFDDYLRRFRKNQRRNIRRERRSMDEAGIELSVIHGSDASELIYQRMAEYYIRTNELFGPYAAQFLTEEFFTAMPEEVRRHVWFVAAFERPEREDPLALAMLVRKGTRLWGRYWGTRKTVKDLHFNVCYYAPIEWAIREGIETFDPGMGSPHKVRRGFRSVSTWSLHHFLDRDMQHILEANIDRINAYEAEQIAYLDDAVPYKAVSEEIHGKE